MLAIAFRRRLMSFLGSLTLVGSALVPLATPADASVEQQTSPDPSAGAVVVAIDEPTNRSGTAASSLLVRGWAANPSSSRGTGVSQVDLYLDGGPDQGGQFLGRAQYGRERPDVADALGGQRFLASGWDIDVDLPRGPHTLVAVAAPSGSQPALEVPGVASIQVAVGGRPGVTTHECGAGGYCTSQEGGFRSRGPGRRNDPIYAGNLYQATGAFGNGPTTPPYGWWDAQLPDLAAYILAYQAFAYPGPQQFWGNVPSLYNQSILSTLSTQGSLAFIGGGCVGPAFAGLDTLGLSVLGGYSFGFPILSGLATTGNGPGTLGFGNATFGIGWGATGQSDLPVAGPTNLGRLFAGGQTLGWNTSLVGLARLNGGAEAGPGGVGGAISSSRGTPFIVGSPLGARVGGDLFTNTGCGVRL
ncbi:MAG TPA: hypothetical protein VII06_04230 [Chloroflexota bacterium]|jgi:hypothetical protein